MPAQQPLNAQLSSPVAQTASQLVTTGAGERVMTISVAPESLGPVTVRAHMSSEGLRIELYAPQEQGREALRAIVADLRRDLAGMGISIGASQVSVSEEDAPAPMSTASSGGAQHGAQHRSPEQQPAAPRPQDRQEHRPEEHAAVHDPVPDPEPADARAACTPGSLDLMV